jgi:hypothetical protein
MKALLPEGLLFAALVLLCPLALRAQTAPAPPPPTQISADMGSCSVLVTVTGADFKPVFYAKVSTRVRSGLFGVKKLDLSAYTSAAGQVKFVGMPETTKHPFVLYISKDGKETSVDFDPELRCQATFDVELK